MPEETPQKPDATGHLIPSSPVTGGNNRPPNTPFKPSQADGGQRSPSTKRLQHGLLVAGVLVGLLFVLILVIAVISTGSGSNVILEQIGIEGDINDILLKVVNFVFGIAGMIAIISLVIGGFIYMAAGGNTQEVKKARRILITSAIILIFLFIVYIAIFTLIRTNTEAAEPDEEQVVQILTNPSPPQGSAPLSIGFDIMNIPEGNYFYSWEFGDGQKGTGKALSHTFQREGNYTTQVVISTGENVLTTLTSSVTVSNTRPNPVIIADPVDGRAPLTVRFDGSRSKDPNGEITSYEWDFGDSESVAGNSNTAVGQLASHTFNKDGFYTVTLKIADNNGEDAYTEQTIEVGVEPDAPTAVITTTPAATGFAPITVKGVAPFKVNFSGSKSRDIDGNIVTYRWDFGDGSRSESGQAVNHTYTDGGTYTATLTVIDNTEKEDTTDVEVVVGDLGQSPTAEIVSVPPATQGGEIKGEVPLAVSLNGAKSKDTDGEITLYEWNLGDNTPLLNGQSVTYTYVTPGTYTLTLTVTDDEGFTNIEPATIVIKALTPGDKHPTAVIKTDPVDASGNIPFTVRFDASESSDTDGTIISYEWDFGDGRTILSGAEATHVYENQGIYTVRLIVHDNDGLTGEVTHPVAAHIAAPIARIEVNRNTGDAPLLVRFDASGSSGDIKRYNWDFGDSESGKGRTIQHTFDTPGEYEVELTVTDTAEQVDAETLTIEVR